MASYVQAVTSKLSSATDNVKQVASSAVEGVSTRAAGLLSAARDTKAAGLAYVASARDLVWSTAESVQKKGMKRWSMEAAWALRLAAGAQAHMLKVSAQARLVDASEKSRQGLVAARGKVVEVSAATKQLVSKKSFQATAGSAVGGAVAMGTGGGATGLVAGGAVGALAGMPLALFTVGLSIPIGAILGGGTGLVAGAVTGATAGAVGGGAVGYGAYTKKDEIAGAARLVQSKASEGANFVKCKASEGASSVKGAATRSVEYATKLAVDTKARVVSKAELQKLKSN